MPGSARRLFASALLEFAVVAGAAHAGTLPQVPLSNVFTWLPGISNDGPGRALTYANAPGGRTGLLTVELDDDFDAVQIGMLNGGTTPWTVTRIAVAPSASYGDDPYTGGTAWAADGNQVREMLPVQWSHGGADSAPPIPGAATLLSLPAVGGDAGGTVLKFGTTIASPAYGGGQPQHGWYVADGLGCVPAGAQVVAVTRTSITLSSPIGGTGCGQGQAIYFSAQPFGPFGYTAPAGPGGGVDTISFSDWVPLSSLPRTDGGFTAGQAVSGPGIASGTTIAAVAPDMLTLSAPLGTALPARTQVTVGSATVALTQATPAGAAVLHVASTSRRRLLHIRFFTDGATSSWLHAPACMVNGATDAVPCEKPLGLGPVWSGLGTSGMDGLDYVGSVGSKAQPTTSYPSFFIRYLGRHPGATVLTCGGYQASGGAGSVSGQASPIRIAAAAVTAQNPSIPISSVTVATQNLDTGPDFANCQNWIQAIRPAIVVFQAYSNHNGATIPDYMAEVRSLAQQVLSQGGQPVIYLGYPETSHSFGSLPVAGDSAGTTVPLATGTNTDVSVTGALVSGPGVPAGTLATTTPGGWSLALSQPAQIPAGSVLHFGLQVATNSGKAVTLTTPAFATSNQLEIAGPGIAQRTQITLKRNSNAATLTKDADIPAGTILSLSVPVVRGGGGYAQAAAAYRGLTDPWAAVQLDGMAVLDTDASHPFQMCEACSTLGRYANDYGNALIAAAFIPMLQQMTGQTR